MDLRMLSSGWIWCFEFPSVIDAVGWTTGRASSLQDKNQALAMSGMTANVLQTNKVDAQCHKLATELN